MNGRNIWVKFSIAIFRTQPLIYFWLAADKPSGRFELGCQESSLVDQVEKYEIYWLSSGGLTTQHVTVELRDMLYQLTKRWGQRRRHQCSPSCTVLQHRRFTAQLTLEQQLIVPSAPWRRYQAAAQTVSYVTNWTVRNLRKDKWRTTPSSYTFI